MLGQKVTFIGGGNMARSLIGGLIANGMNKNNINVVDPNEAQRHLLANMGVATYAEADVALKNCDILVLAVKPQVMANVANSIAPLIKQYHPLVISVAAGIRCNDLSRWLGGEVAIVRTMPNTPAFVQSGATGLYANALVSHEQKNQAESLMRACGICVWVAEEAQIDSVTALSGSGPAYYFLMMEAMINAGESLGLDKKTATLLTVQTALGAAKMAIESQDTPATLRAQVTSPNGTTEAAILTFQQHHFEKVVSAAMQAARTRAETLATELGTQA
ncbi:MAG: pyrroline-5-carboxylate reductase [Thiotrichales bacterium]|jgi:pyrroline-5-carboxylate reductase|nr:pyrroline-5-carboxylate reductase [Thiotrichales bacterium]